MTKKYLHSGVNPGPSPKEDDPWSSTVVREGAVPNESIPGDFSSVSIRENSLISIAV